MLLKLRVLLLLWCGGVVGLSPRIFTLTPPIKIPIPLPPNCQEKAPTDPGRPVSLTKYMLDITKPILSGVILWSEKVTTTCSTGIFGSEEKSIDKRVIEMISPEDLSDLRPVSSSEGEITDLSPDPMYDCVWPRTETKTTTRLYQKSVSAYPTLHGGFTVDSVRWILSSNSSIYRHQHRIFMVLRDYERNCPLVTVDSYTGVLHRLQNSTYQISVPSVGLQFDIDTSKALLICEGTHEPHYYTNLGFIISSNLSSEHYPSGKSLHELLLGPNYFEYNILGSEMNFDLTRVSEIINMNFDNLRIALCHLRGDKWREIVHSGDTDALASYASGDPFAVGRIRDGAFYIQTRVPHLLNITLDHLTVRTGEHLHYFNGSGWIDIESVSGIISPPRDPLPLLPPILALKNQSYYDVRTGRVITPHLEFDYTKLDLPKLTREMASVDEYQHWDEVEAVEGSSTFRSSVFVEFWDWFTSGLNFLKILGGLIVVVIIGYVLIKFTTLCKRRSQSPLPESYPMYLRHQLK